ncbi:hypothetical protein [Oceanobacillus limi]|nr:hypothetical protein [Oceanobacillus limi]
MRIVVPLNGENTAQTRSMRILIPLLAINQRKSYAKKVNKGMRIPNHASDGLFVPFSGMRIHLVIDEDCGSVKWQKYRPNKEYEDPHSSISHKSAQIAPKKGK